MRVRAAGVASALEPIPSLSGARMNARLVVLGLPQQEPTHGYDILKRIAPLHVGPWAVVVPGAIYRALKQVQVVSPTRQASRSHGTPP